MTIDTEPISSHAICRECSKEFSSRNRRGVVSFRAMWTSITKHIKLNPGHTVIGNEQTRIIAK